MSADKQISTDHTDRETEQNLELPMTATIGRMLRIAIPSVVAKAADIPHGAFVAVRIVSLNQKTLTPPPHAFIARVQMANYYITVPRANASLIGANIGDVIDCYIRRVK